MDENSTSKNLPWEVAEMIANDYNKRQVIIVTWDVTGAHHVATFGKSIEDSRQAAQGGNFIKKALGFPEEDCKSIPAKVQKADMELEELKKQVVMLRIKADRWDALEEQISGYYVDGNGDELSDEEGGDLTDIGETAARAFGYL